MRWEKGELELIEKYFKSSLSELLLFNKILAINPNRTYGAILRKIYEYKEQGYDKKPHLKKLRVGYLDIECSNLSADMGLILSWFIKARGQNVYYSSLITKKELFDYTFDYRVVKELLEAFEHFDVLWTHWGKLRRFDVPYIISRAYKNNLQHLLPKNCEKFIFDTWDIARSKLRLHSNRLDSIGNLLNIKNVKKTALNTDIWCKAGYGQEDALNYIYVHNRRDVQLLEAIHKKLEIISTPIINSFRSM